MIAGAGQPLYGKPYIALSLSHPEHQSRLNLTLEVEVVEHLIIAVGGGHTAAWPERTDDATSDCTSTETELTLNGTMVRENFDSENDCGSDPLNNVILLTTATRP